MPAGEDRRREALILSRIRRLQRRLNIEVALREAVVPLWCAATAVTLHRLLLSSHTGWVAAGAFMVALGIWWVRGRRRRISQTDASILLDRAAGAGGLLLTRLELPVGAWELGLNENVRRAAMPDIDARRPASLSVLALCFAVAALLVPLPERITPTVNAAAASRIAQVEAQAEALAEAVPLQDGIEAELARLREELAEGAFDAADWEAADNLQEGLAREAAQAAAELARAAEAAEALADATADAQPGEAIARQREALERALMNLEADAESGAQALERALAKLESTSEAGDRAPSTSELSQLREALTKRQQQLENAFGQGQGRQQARGSGAPSEAQGEGNGQPGVSAQTQAQAAGRASNQRGGPSRGGGEGELRFDQPVEMDPSRLAFAPLPKGRGGEPGELWGLRAVDPKPTAEPAANTGASGVAAQGEQAPAFDQSARLPRNRELVRRYFDSQRN